MKNEIEAQFLDIDKDSIHLKLEEIGAKLEKPEVLMRRVVFYTGEHSFARVRNEGEKEAEFILTFVPIDKAIEMNTLFKTDKWPVKEQMVERENRVLEIIKKHAFTLNIH